MGSTRAWWLAAVDDRIACAVGVACLTRYQNLIAHGQLRQHGVYYFVERPAEALRRRGGDRADRAAAVPGPDGRTRRRLAGRRHRGDRGARGQGVCEPSGRRTGSAASGTRTSATPTRRRCARRCWRGSPAGSAGEVTRHGKSREADRMDSPRSAVVASGPGDRDVPAGGERRRSHPGALGGRLPRARAFGADHPPAPAGRAGQRRSRPRHGLAVLPAGALRRRRAAAAGPDAAAAGAGPGPHRHRGAAGLVRPAGGALAGHSASRAASTPISTITPRITAFSASRSWPSPICAGSTTARG